MAQRQAWDAEPYVFQLDAPGIGDDPDGSAYRRDRVQVAQGLDQVQSTAPGLTSSRRQAIARSRMQGEDHGNGKSRQCVQNVGQETRIVSQFRAMERREEV
jgi:hypothetical protein